MPARGGGAFDEQGHRAVAAGGVGCHWFGRNGKPLEAIDMLARDLQRHLAGDQNARPRTSLQQRLRHARHLIDQMLGVVERDRHLQGPQCLHHCRQRIACSRTEPQRGAGAAHDMPGVADAGQVHPCRALCAGGLWVSGQACGPRARCR